MCFRRDVMVREPTTCVSTSNSPHQNVVIWTGYGQDQMGSKSTTHVITGAEMGPDSNWPREESNEQRSENANLNPNHFVSWCGESRHHWSCMIEYYLPIDTDAWIMEHQRYGCARDGMFQMTSLNFVFGWIFFCFPDCRETEAVKILEHGMSQTGRWTQIWPSKSWRAHLWQRRILSTLSTQFCKAWNKNDFKGSFKVFLFFFSSGVRLFVSKNHSELWIPSLPWHPLRLLQRLRNQAVR